MHVDIELQRIDIMLTEGRQGDALRQLEGLLAMAKREEGAKIRLELEEWLIGRIDPKDAGLMNGRRIVNEINRICPKEPSDG